MLEDVEKKIWTILSFVFVNKKKVKKKSYEKVTASRSASMGFLMLQKSSKIKP